MNTVLQLIIFDANTIATVISTNVSVFAQQLKSTRSFQHRELLVHSSVVLQSPFLNKINPFLTTLWVTF